MSGDTNPDLCDAGALLHQLSYQPNRELGVAWVHDKPVDGGYILKCGEYMKFMHFNCGLKEFQCE